LFALLTRGWLFWIWSIRLNMKAIITKIAQKMAPRFLKKCLLLVFFSSFFSNFFWFCIKIHRKSCHAHAQDSVDWKNLSCYLIPKNDVDFLQHSIQKGKGDLCFGRCWRRPPGLIRATPKNPDRNRNCPRPPVSWPGCRFRATSAKRLRRTWRRSFVQYSHGSDLITRAGAWPKMRCCHLRWSTTSFRPRYDW